MFKNPNSRQAGIYNTPSPDTPRTDNPLNNNPLTLTLGGVKANSVQVRRDSDSLFVVNVNAPRIPGNFELCYWTKFPGQDVLFKGGEQVARQGSYGRVFDGMISRGIIYHDNMFYFWKGHGNSFIWYGIDLPILAYALEISKQRFRINHSDVPITPFVLGYQFGVSPLPSRPYPNGFWFKFLRNNAFKGNIDVGCNQFSSEVLTKVRAVIRRELTAGLEIKYK